jgi:hypothetical protein
MLNYNFTDKQPEYELSNVLLHFALLTFYCPSSSSSSTFSVHFHVILQYGLFRIRIILRIIKENWEDLGVGWRITLRWTLGR